MSKSRRSFGRVVPHRDGYKVMVPTGFRTNSGRTAYETIKFSGPKAKQRAEKALRQIRRQKLAGKWRPKIARKSKQPLRVPSVSDVVQEYIDFKTGELSEGTLDLYRITLKAVTEHGLGERDVSSIGVADVMEFLRWRRTHHWRRHRGETVLITDREASPTLLRRERAHLCAVLNWLVLMERLDRNPVSRVPAPKIERAVRPYLSKGEVQKLLAACPTQLRRMVLVGILAGPRPSEIVNVRVRDLNLDDATLHMRRKKTGQHGTIPLHRALVPELRAQLEDRVRARGGPVHQEEHLFLSRRGAPFKKFPREAFASALRAADIDGRGITPHCLRHTFATHFEGDTRDLQELLGHSSITTTEIYRKSLSRRAREAVDTIDFGLETGRETRRAGAPKSAPGGGA